MRNDEGNQKNDLEGLMEVENNMVDWKRFHQGKKTTARSNRLFVREGQLPWIIYLYT